MLPPSTAAPFLRPAPERAPQSSARHSYRLSGGAEPEFFTDTSSEYEATIIDVFFDTLTVTCEKGLDVKATYSIEQKAPELLQALISCLEGIYAVIHLVGL